jgi:hypothetical protein
VEQAIALGTPYTQQRALHRQAEMFAHLHRYDAAMTTYHDLSCTNACRSSRRRPQGWCSARSPRRHAQPDGNVARTRAAGAREGRKRRREDYFSDVV